MWVVATTDQPGLFAKIAGTFAVHGIDVAGAEVWTSLDGIAVDQFVIVPRSGDGPNCTKIDNDLLDVLSGRIDVVAGSMHRVRTYSRAHRRAVAASPPRLGGARQQRCVDSTTMIDVRAPDAIAVLYRLASALAALGLDIRSAKVATLGHEVDRRVLRAAGRRRRQVARASTTTCATTSSALAATT